MNVSGQVAGITDTPLTDEGRMQAKKAGQLAKGLSIDTIVSSPLSRTLETAQIIAKEISYPSDKIFINRLLVERDFGSLEGLPWSIERNFDSFADVETTAAVVQRANLALAWMKSLDSTNILVVSHGTFGRALRSILIAKYTMDYPDGLSNAEIHNWL